MRDSYDDLLEEGTAPLEHHPDGVQWHIFAGRAVNRLLAAGLERKSGKKWVAGNLSLRCKDIAFTATSDAIRSLADLNWERVATDAAREMARGMLSKFQPCLPEEAEARLLSERLRDQLGLGTAAATAANVTASLPPAPAMPPIATPAVTAAKPTRTLRTPSAPVSGVTTPRKPRGAKPRGTPSGAA